MTLRSKVRGESSEYASRYVSPTTFFATAPIRGLVYSVVHDPPGGNSYASIAKGTAVNTVVELNKAFSGSVGEGWSTNGGWGASMDVKTNSEAMISGFGPIIGGAIEIDTGNTGGGGGDETVVEFRCCSAALCKHVLAAGARNGEEGGTGAVKASSRETTIGFSAGLEGGDEEMWTERLRVDVDGRRMESRYDFG